MQAQAVNTPNTLASTTKASEKIIEDLSSQTLQIDACAYSQHAKITYHQGDLTSAAPASIISQIQQLGSIDKPILARLFVQDDQLQVHLLANQATSQFTLQLLDGPLVVDKSALARSGLVLRTMLEETDIAAINTALNHLKLDSTLTSKEFKKITAFYRHDQEKKLAYIKLMQTPEHSFSLLKTAALLDNPMLEHSAKQALFTTAHTIGNATHSGNFRAINSLMTTARQHPQFNTQEKQALLIFMYAGRNSLSEHNGPATVQALEAQPTSVSYPELTLAQRIGKKQDYNVACFSLALQLNNPIALAFLTDDVSPSLLGSIVDQQENRIIGLALTSEPAIFNALVQSLNNQFGAEKTGEITSNTLLNNVTSKVKIDNVKTLLELNNTLKENTFFQTTLLVNSINHQDAELLNQLLDLVNLDFTPQPNQQYSKHLDTLFQAVLQANAIGVIPTLTQRELYISPNTLQSAMQDCSYDLIKTLINNNQVALNNCVEIILEPRLILDIDNFAQNLNNLMSDSKALEISVPNTALDWACALTLPGPCLDSILASLDNPQSLNQDNFKDVLEYGLYYIQVEHHREPYLDFLTSMLIQMASLNTDIDFEGLKAVNFQLGDFGTPIMPFALLAKAHNSGVDVNDVRNAHFENFTNNNMTIISSYLAKNNGIDLADLRLCLDNKESPELIYRLLESINPANSTLDFSTLLDIIPADYLMEPVKLCLQYLNASGFQASSDHIFRMIEKNLFNVPDLALQNSAPNINLQHLALAADMLLSSITSYQTPCLLNLYLQSPQLNLQGAAAVQFDPQLGLDRPYNIHINKRQDTLYDAFYNLVLGGQLESSASQIHQFLQQIQMAHMWKPLSL